MSERIAVVGIGQTEFKSRWPEISQVEMVNLAVRRALENAHLTIKDIDAVFVGNMELFEGNYQVGAGIPCTGSMGAGFVVDDCSDSRFLAD